MQIAILDNKAVLILGISPDGEDCLVLFDDGHEDYVEIEKIEFRY